MTTVVKQGTPPGTEQIRRALDEAGFPHGADAYRVLVVEQAAEATDEALLAGRAEDRRTIVVLHGTADVPTAWWHLLDRGAADVLPWAGAATVTQVVERVRRWRRIDEHLASPLVAARMIGRSPALLSALRDLVELALFSRGPILLVGETGTGKELAARIVDELSTPAGVSNLVVVDCATIVPSLSGSELFGHERGAFTGADRPRSGAIADADGGTLFLDEVGELPLDLQSELLRVVQEHTYKRVGGNTWARSEFRLVSATNRNLVKEQRKGRFRSDLYHRIAAGVVRLPPLRERMGDVEELFRHFLADEMRAPPPRLSAAVAAMLRSRDFPGNLRELRQLAVRVAARHVGSGPVTPGDIPDADRPRPQQPPAAPRDPVVDLEAAVRGCLDAGMRLPDLKGLVADLAVATALSDADGHTGRAADRLGVTDRAVQLRKRGTRQASG